MKTRYDTKATGHQFKEGDKVWFYNPTRRKGLSPKLQSHWDGPYTILKIINDVVIRILQLQNSVDENTIPRECQRLGKFVPSARRKIHFAAKCFQNTKNIQEMNVPKNELVYIDSVNENETKCVMINSTDSNFKNVEMLSETTRYENVSLDVNNKCFDGNFKLDTGAEPNVSLIINCSTDKLKNVPLPFYVLNVKSKPISELRGSKELKLIERIDAIECSISKNELIKQNKDVFNGVEEFPNEPFHITLKDNAVPVIYRTRRVPLALQPKLKGTLGRLEKEGIVSKVNKPTDWVQSSVLCRKTQWKFKIMFRP
ncbi:uncharacterized protein TNCV_612121 [Trichonephila clavipes]|nr:uncharacterized protein TNCV_612121 [Trichonephila clavipes]